MLRIEQVLGSRLDPAFAAQIHELEHHGAVDLLTVPVADVARHRFRATTQGGTEVAIALPRDQRLYDGAVLVLEPDHAVVVRVAQERWLRLQPRPSPTRSSLAIRPATCIGGSALPAKRLWSPWKRRWTSISPGSAV